MTTRTYPQRLLQYIRVIAGLWIVEIVDRLLFGNRLEWHGIHPRDWSHWEGILFSPFLHGNWGHLIGNSISLLILGATILVQGWRTLLHVSIVSALSAGILIFFIGARNSVHIGSSSVVFGYLGYLIGMGIYQRTPTSILLAILVLIFYGGGIATMFPTTTSHAAQISWEAHLGGAIGGFLMAKRNRKPLSK